MVVVGEWLRVFVVVFVVFVVFVVGVCVGVFLWWVVVGVCVGVFLCVVVGVCVGVFLWMFKTSERALSWGVLECCWRMIIDGFSMICSEVLEVLGRIPPPGEK